jgi:ribosomal protein L31
MIIKRGLQSLIHPQKYIRVLKLTDGSIIRVSSLSPPPSNDVPYTVSLLNLDSANHPSWNPELRDKLLLDDRGQVAKFRAKFEKNDDDISGDSTSMDYGDFLEMDPSINLNESGNQLTKVKTKVPVKAVQKKKK